MASIASDQRPSRRTGPIALLLPTLEIGGAELAVSRLAGALAARAERVDLVVGRVCGLHGRAMVPPGVRLVELGTRRMLTSIGALSRYLRREQPICLLANLTHANAIALLARRHMGQCVRIVVVEHSTLSEFARHSGVFRHRLLPLVARLTYPWADAVVTVSQQGRSDLAQVTGLPEHRMKVIPNPLAYDEVALLAAAKPPDPWLVGGPQPLVLAIGSLRRIKGHVELLHAFAALRKRREARLAVLGDGPERRRLERLVQRLGLAGDVLLPGSQTNPYAWISRAGCVVMTSRSEGRPTVLLEALMLGRPVVAVDQAGAREVLDGGRLGALTAPGDEAALVEQIERALETGARPVPPGLAATHHPAYIAEQYLDLLVPAPIP